MLFTANFLWQGNDKKITDNHSSEGPPCGNLAFNLIARAVRALEDSSLSKPSLSVPEKPRAINLAPINGQISYDLFFIATLLSCVTIWRENCIDTPSFYARIEGHVLQTCLSLCVSFYSPSDIDSSVTAKNMPYAYTYSIYAIECVLKLYFVSGIFFDIPRLMRVFIR